MVFIFLKTVVRCHEVGGNALTVCMLSGPRASPILVKGSANLLSYNTAVLLLAIIIASEITKLKFREAEPFTEGYTLKVC